jgi:hypothetical protein
MRAEITTVIDPAAMYERLQTATAAAGISVYRLADEASVTPMTLYGLKAKGGQKTWTVKTLNGISTVLARHLDRRPSEVYAYLTGLEPIDLSLRSS